jgi:hypothetical protein
VTGDAGTASGSQGLQVRNPDLSYSVATVAEYLSALQAAWEICLELSVTSFLEVAADLGRPPVDLPDQIAATLLGRVLRAVEDTPDRPLPDRIKVAVEEELRNLEQVFFVGEQARTTISDWFFEQWPRLTSLLDASTEALEGRTLRIDFLRIASPMEMVVTAVTTGGSVGVCIYATHLLARILSEPETVGSWFPEVLASWHRGKAKVAEARVARLVAERELDEMKIAELPSISAKLLKAEVVTPFDPSHPLRKLEE